MKWTDCRQIAEFLNLEVNNQGNVEEVKRALRLKMADAHPDNNEGKTDQSFYVMNSAKEFLDSQTNTGSALVRLDQLPEMIRAITLATQTSEASSSQTKKSVTQEIRQHALLPRIGSAAIATACTTIYVFSEKVSQHPTLGPLLTSPQGTAIIATILSVSSIYFCATYYAERKISEKIDYWLTEGGIEEIFQYRTGSFTTVEVADIILSCSPSFRSDDSMLFRMSRRDSVGGMRRFARRFLTTAQRVARCVFPSTRLTYASAEKIVKTQINYLIDSGNARQASRKGGVNTYELVRDDCTDPD